MTVTVQALTALGACARRSTDAETASTAAGAALRPIAPWIAAALAMAALLLSLGWVVQNHVRQAQARHAADAVQTAALGRCASLPQRALRDQCRQLALLQATQAAR